VLALAALVLIGSVCSSSEESAALERLDLKDAAPPPTLAAKTEEALAPVQAISGRLQPSRDGRGRSATERGAALPSASVSRPPGVDEASWMRLVSELGAGSDELARIVAHLTWADAAARFRAAAPGSMLRRELAGQLDAGLEERLASRELHAAEALAWKRALLEVRVDDPVEREAMLRAWRSRQPAGAFASPAQGPDQRQRRFERLQAELLTRHGKGGDARVVEAELDALRARVYGTPASED
jgi:hypothetical protein